MSNTNTHPSTGASADHRRYDPASVFKTMRISSEAEAAIQNIRQMWLTEYPESKYPSIALLFEVALKRFVVELQGDPTELKQEVEAIKKHGFGFRRRRKESVNV